MNFTIFATIYLTISMSSIFLMIVMGRKRVKVFRQEFGHSIEPEDLNGEDLNRWEKLHNKKFNSGFWRAVMLFYLVFHYPGFFVNAVLGNDEAHPKILLPISALVWLGIGYLTIR